jgi:hypothetical protein
MTEINNLEFKNRIENVKSYIELRYEHLKIEAIWLFVASLGCWSVNNKYMQIVSFLIVLVLFCLNLGKGKDGELTFSQRLNEIKNDINNSDLEDDLKKARFYEIDNINRDWLSISSSYKKTPEFVITYLFWGGSLIIASYRIFN